MTRPAAICEHARPSGQAGQALVELAVLLPVIVLVAMGVVDFGRVMYAYVTLSSATQAGAEYAARTQSLDHTAVLDSIIWESNSFLSSANTSIGDLRFVDQDGLRLARVTAVHSFRTLTPVPFDGPIPLRVTVSAPTSAFGSP